VLLHQLKPDQCSLAPLKTPDLRTRAEQVSFFRDNFPLQILRRVHKVLQNAANIGCRKYLTPASLVAGNPRLNLAFVANLFNSHPGLEPLDEQEAKEYGVVEDFDAEGEREARVFTLWLNSLGVEPGVFNLFENLKDGLVILQAFDKVLPGSVVWRRVSKPKIAPGETAAAAFSSGGGGEEDEEEEIGVKPNQSQLTRFKAVENTNYAVELGRQSGMSLVGIQGADIVDGRKTLVLGLVWQLMRSASLSLPCPWARLIVATIHPRMSITKTLTSLSKTGQGRPISDTEMLKWANTTVQKAKPAARPIRSFRDPSITTGLFFLDLLEAIRPGSVDPALVNNVNEDSAYDERRQNGACLFPVDMIGCSDCSTAKLAISIARKMNALIFLVPEDIVDVRPRLVRFSLLLQP
jgi:plastin-1